MRFIQKTGISLQVSGEDFIGGIRAEIPHKNILIDNSFAANARCHAQRIQI